jgi:hypothetical protein
MPMRTKEGSFMYGLYIGKALPINVEKQGGQPGGGVGGVGGVGGERIFSMTTDN